MGDATDAIDADAEKEIGSISLSHTLTSDSHRHTLAFLSALSASPIA